MKIKWIPALCSLVLLSCAVSMFGQQLDIEMDGPWIYYVDKDYQHEGKTKTALIAMAPNAPGHYPPTFTTGSGGKLTAGSSGLYCLGHDGKCAIGQQQNAYLYKGNYPDLQILPVKKASSNWKWFNWLTVEQKQGWYVILPMPDSVSNEGVEPMTLRDTFGAPTAVGGPYEKPHSIGIQLHYSNWPSGSLALYQCAAPGVDTCAISSEVMKQLHYGTLKISMAAHEEPDPRSASAVCDYHVRAAYHSMIMFVDNSDLTLGHNANKQVGYINLPVIDPDGIVADHYDDDKCLLCDPQNPIQTCPMMAMGLDYWPQGLKDLLDKIEADLQNKLLDGYQNALNAKKLKAGIEAWPKDRFPEAAASQELEADLKHSLQGATDIFEKELDEERKSDAGNLPLVQSLQNLMNDERAAIGRIIPIGRHPKSTGKDCGVSQMWIQ